MTLRIPPANHEDSAKIGDFQMLKFSILSFAIGILLIVSTSLVGQERNPDAKTKKIADPVQDKNRLAQLVVQLASDRAKTRYKAMDELSKCGSNAVSLLMEAIPTGDLDFRIRALKVIQQLGMSEDESSALAAEEALLQLADSASHRIAHMAETYVNQLFKEKAKRALDLVRAAGAWIRTENLRIGAQYHYQLQTIVLDDQWKGDQATLQQIRYLREIKAIEFSGKRFDDQIASLLPSRSHLVSISFKGTQVSNAAIASCHQHRQLQQLVVQYANAVDSQCLSDLAKISRLAEVKFYGTGIGRDQLPDFEKQLQGVVVDIRVGGFLGIRYTQTSPTCLVTTVVKDSGAEKGGIKVGDTIVEYGGHEIGEPSTLSKVISDHKVGQKIKVKVLRGTEIVELEVTLTRWQ